MANTGLNAAIIEVQKMMKALPGVRAAPNYIEGKSSQFPYFETWPGPGNWESNSYAFLQGILSICIVVHIQENTLMLSEEKSMVYVELVPRTLMADSTLNGTVSTFGDIEFSGLLRMQLGETPTIGYRWTIKDVKIH